jgi:EAL domain-containing protein (putative c-di-GMP-specific phosphodiesterase class I)
MRCEECERIRSVLHPENRILVALPTAFTWRKVADVAGRAADLPCPDDRSLDLSLSRVEATAFAATLSGALSATELAESRVLVLPAGRSPAVGDMLGAMSLKSFVATVTGLWLADMIEGDRLVSALQPIVTRDGAVYAHEALLRGRRADGSLASAGEIFGVAIDTHLLFTVDLAARRSALETVARAVGPDARIFVNFNPSSIYDPSFCLRETVSFIEELGLVPANVVFEVVESDEVRDSGHLRRILEYYRAAGFRIALDDIGAGFSGLGMLQALRPDVVKIDMGLIRGIDADVYRQSIIGHVIGIAKDTGALCVAEGVETEAERAWLLGAGVDLLQGYLIGRPALPV